jgi:hypothetical protein
LLRAATTTPLSGTQEQVFPRGAQRANGHHVINHLHQLYLHASQTFTCYLPLIKHRRSIVAPRVSKTRESWKNGCALHTTSHLYQIITGVEKFALRMRVVSAGYANVAIGMEIFRSSLTNNLHSQTTPGSKSFLEANKFPESFRNHSVDPRSISAWPKPSTTARSRQQLKQFLQKSYYTFWNIFVIYQQTMILQALLRSATGGSN